MDVLASNTGEQMNGPLFILYCYDKQLRYWDWFRCRNCWLNQYTLPSESYWMVPMINPTED